MVLSVSIMSWTVLSRLTSFLSVPCFNYEWSPGLYLVLYWLMVMVCCCGGLGFSVTLMHLWSVTLWSMFWLTTALVMVIPLAYTWSRWLPNLWVAMSLFSEGMKLSLDSW